MLDDIDARLPLNLPEGMIKSLAGRGLPAFLKGRITVSEELQNRRFVLQDKTSLRPAPDEPCDLDLGNRGLLDSRVGEVKDALLLTNRHFPGARGDDLAIIDKVQISIEMIE